MNATPRLARIHHAAIICSDYALSKRFYSEVLGLRIVAEHLRAERNSYKLALALPDGSQLELFSLPDPPPRVSRPEARGLRHLAFEVPDVRAAAEALEAQVAERLQLNEGAPPAWPRKCWSPCGLTCARARCRMGPTATSL